MAIESLIGGGGGPGEPVLPPEAIEVLDFYLDDMIGSSITTEILGGGAQLILGDGVDGQPQGAVIAGDVAVAGEVNDDVMTLSFILPPEFSFVFEGLGNQDFASPEEIKDLFDARIEEELPENSADPEVTAIRESLFRAIDNLTTALAAQGITNSIIRIIDFSSLANSNNNVPDDSLIISTNATAGQIITLNASGSTNNEVFALLLDKLASGAALELKGIESAVLVGSGTVFVGDNNSANLQGDNANQQITGGGGNDTLVGGGGNDTLIGGAGDDVIGFTALGHYTVDIDLSDKLAFQFDGVTSVDDLVAALTDISEANGNITYEFLDGHASITLVGATASEVTENLLQFHL